MTKIDGGKDIVQKIGKWLTINYWGPLYKTIKKDPRLLETFPAFLLKPEKLIFYIGRTHIGIEYVGPERLPEIPEKGQLEAQVSFVCTYAPTRRAQHFRNRLMTLDYSLFRCFSNGASMIGGAKKSINS